LEGSDVFCFSVNCVSKESEHVVRTCRKRRSFCVGV